MRDKDLRGNPWRVFEDLQANGPLVKAEIAYATADHGLVHALLRDPRFGMGARETAYPPLPRVLRWFLDATDPHLPGPADDPAMLGVDPPQHTRYRRLVAAAFTPRAVEAFRTVVEETAQSLLDELEDLPEVDLASTYAAKLPILVISQLLGAPDYENEVFLRLGHDIAALLDPGLALRPYLRGMLALREGRAIFDEYFEFLRLQPEIDNLLSRLARERDEEGSLSNEELMGIVLLVLGAGFETTVSMLGNATVLLSQHPDQRDLLLADPTLWPNAIEEVLRYDSPVKMTSRMALEDVEVAGHNLPRGSVVVIHFNGANRDPKVFPDPHRFDITRANARDHLAFSGGTHFCPGTSLARMEGQIALRALFERHPQLRLAREPVRRDLLTIGGWDRLDVVLGPRSDVRHEDVIDFMDRARQRCPHHDSSAAHG